MKTIKNLLLMFLLFLSVATSIGQQLTLQLGEQDCIKGLTYSPDSKFILTHNNHSLNIRNSLSGKIIYNLDHSGEYHIDKSVFSADSKRLISHNQKTIKVWNLANGKLETTMQGETEYRFRFLPHKDLIALQYPYHSIVIRSMKDGSLINSFPIKDTNSNGGGYGNIVSFSPNEELIAFTDRMWTTQTIHIANIQTGIVDTLRLNRQGIRSLHFSHDNKLLASAHSTRSNDLVHIWDIKSKKLLHTLQINKQKNHFSPEFSPNDNLLVTHDYHYGQTTIWNTQTGALIDSFMINNQRIHKIIFSKDDKFVTLLSTSNNDINRFNNYVENYYIANITTWSLEEKAIINTVEKDVKYANSLTFSPNGSGFVVKRNLSESNDQLELWDLKDTATQKPTTIIKNVQLAELPKFTFSKKDELIFYNDTSISVWNTKNDLTFKKKHVFESQILGKSQDGRLYALNTSFGDMGLQVFDINTSKVIDTYKKHDTDENDVQFSADNRYLISSNYGETIKVYDLKDQKLLHVIIKNRTVDKFIFSPDSKYFAISYFTKIDIYETISGKRIQTLKPKSSYTNQFVFTPDGQSIILGLENITVFSVKTGKKIFEFDDKEPRSILNQIQNMPNGKFILTSYEPNQVKVWDIKTGKLVRKFEEPVKNIKMVNYSPNGKFLITSHQNNQMKFWDMETMELKMTLLFFPKSQSYLVYTPDGKYDGDEDYFHLLTYTKDLKVEALPKNDSNHVKNLFNKVWSNN